MELNFDNRGNLKPYEIIEISTVTFQQIFVNSFDEASTRQQLFFYYEKYMEDFSNLITKDFYQWIDGSFLSNKKNPRDIDMVTIIDFEDYESNKAILEREFASFAGRNKYKVDAYIVANYPENHEKHIFTRSDLLFRRNLFGRTRVNRAKKQYGKGIIQLNFMKDER